jgi:hypothetical protein
VNLLAAKAGPGAEMETGLDSKSAVAFEKHRIRRGWRWGHAWRDYHESILARLPFVHSCTADAAVQEDLRRADERQERAARNLVQSFTFGLCCARQAPGDQGCPRGRAPPRTKLAALRSGVPTFSGLRDLGRGPRKTQKARRSSAGALLNINKPPRPQVLGRGQSLNKKKKRALDRCCRALLISNQASAEMAGCHQSRRRGCCKQRHTHTRAVRCILVLLTSRSRL